MRKVTSHDHRVTHGVVHQTVSFREGEGRADLTSSPMPVTILSCAHDSTLKTQHFRTLFCLQGLLLTNPDNKFIFRMDID